MRRCNNVTGKKANYYTFISILYKNLGKVVFSLLHCYKYYN